MICLSDLQNALKQRKQDISHFFFLTARFSAFSVDMKLLNDISFEMKNRFVEGTRAAIEAIKLRSWISFRERKRHDYKSREKFQQRLIVTACWKLIGDEETARVVGEQVLTLRRGTE